MSNLRHWLWLTNRSTSAGMYAARMLEHFGSPEAAYFADPSEYARLTDLPKPVREALEDKDLSGAEKILNDCERLNIRILTLQDTEYPERLANMESPPCVLYVKGRLPRFDEEVAVTLVGSRKASAYGLMTASRLGMELARQGAMVVSGAARGIDTAALKGALQGGGRVAAVLGNGIDVAYPPENQYLYEDIAAAGALISEYPPGTPPLGAHFPVRNRILAGLCLGVVVVEGQERSGSLITARWALEENRDVFAVPGQIDARLSVGPNRLIKNGEAKLVQDAWDILGEYEELYPDRIRPKVPLKKADESARMAVATPKQTWKEPKPIEPEPLEELTPAKMVIDRKKEPDALSEEEAAILRCLNRGEEKTADELGEETGLTARCVLSALTILQVRQLLTEVPGKRFASQVELRE